MKKAIEEKTNIIEKLKKEITLCKKFNLELKRENAKLQKQLIKQKVQLVSERNRIVALEKLIPESLKPLTYEERLQRRIEQRKK